MAEIIPGLNNLDWGGIMGQVVGWIGWFLMAVIVVLVIFGGFYFLSFPKKIRYYPLCASGKDGYYSFSKPKTNLARTGKDKRWELLFPLFKGKKCDPFGDQYKLPGDNYHAIESNGTLIPMRVNVNKTADQLTAEINPVPDFVRSWQSMKHKENQLEFSKQDWWDMNKAYVYALLTAALCLAMCGLTVWLTYKFAGPGIAETGRLADAIKGFATIK